MSFIAQCFGSVSSCLYGAGESWAAAVAAANHAPTQTIPASQPIPDVILDTSTMGQEAVVVKNGSRLCGQGAVRASTPILQNKAYWEVKLQQSGKWSCGLCTPSCDLNSDLGLDRFSWGITSDGVIRSNAQPEYKMEQMVQEGDVLGFTYDHVELNFFLNGTNLNYPILGIKGTVFPVMYVDDGAILDVIFESFRHTPSGGFDRIMVEKALL